MRNRNTIYFTPQVFDELLATNQMGELKKRLLHLLKSSSSMDGLYALKKYILAFPEEELRECPPFLLMAAILASMDGNRLQAEHFLSWLQSCESLLPYAAIYMPNTDTRSFLHALRKMKQQTAPNLPLNGCMPSILNGIRDFSCYGKFLVYARESVTQELKSLYGNDSIGMVDVALAEYLYQKNECFDALSIAVAAMPLIQQNGNVAVLLAALFVQLRVLTVKGQVASLRPLVNSIETTISQTDYTLHKKCLENLRTWCALYDGDWNIIDDWLSQQEHNTAQSLHYMNILTQFIQIRIYLQTERCYLAISLAEQLIPLLEYWHREKDLCEARLLYALALSAIDQSNRAYELLDVTLPVLKRRRFDRLAADEGEQMYRLLRNYRKTRSLQDAYLDRIITLTKEMGLLYPDYLRRRHEKFTPLTQAELHVLTLIADGRSNVQIADYLDISVNTVKFHCKNIFHKLDVSNRRQAIKTAQELKLLRR